jgi:uncharacterized membrane protein HdeD (DUF308 family)
MSSIVQQVGQMAEDQIKRLRWMLGINGVLSILFGVVIIVWPNISLYALVIVFGAFALARGIFGLAAAIGSPVKQGRGWLVFSSLAAIATGVVVFFWTDMSALALLYVIGAYAIALGILTIGAAVRLPLPNSDRLILALTGFVGVLFGIVMFVNPGDGALVLLSLIAAYSLIVGVIELVAAIGGKRLLQKAAQDFMTPAGPQAQH